jgi:hypothetical protein
MKIFNTELFIRKAKQLLLIVTLLSCYNSAAFGQTPIDSWPDQFLRSLGDGIGETWDDAGLKLSSSLFESITDRELFSTKITGELGIKLGVVRKVFNNQDIIDTFTVIDIMNVPLFLPIPLMNGEIGVTNGVFSLGLGVNIGAKAIHIRQVGPKALEELKSIEEVETILNEASLNAEAIEEEVNQKTSKEDEAAQARAESEKDHSFENFTFLKHKNPLVRARYNKIWNLLTHPLGLPLNAKRMQQKPVGDIFSYSLEGSIQLGASVGWSDFSVGGLDLTETKAGVGITTYVKGRYQISLWKEDKDTAQIKLTRQKQLGLNVSLGQTELEHTLFEGFVIMDQNVLKIKESIIPFSVNMNRAQTKQFDVGYRFDLRNEQARAAYDSATLGRFKLAHSLSLLPDSGVTRAFEKDSTTTTTGIHQTMKLSILFEKKSGRSFSKAKAVITLDEKESLLFKSTAGNFTSYDSIWGSYEKKSHRFITTYNETADQRGDKDAFAMRIEARIEDSSTTADELAEIKEEIEIITGKRDIFPKLPKFDPTIECADLSGHLEDSLDPEDCEELAQKKTASYGATSFFYQVNLSTEQLERIQKASRQEMWRALELAFGVKKGRWKNSFSRILNGALHSYATLLNIPLAAFQINLQHGGRLIIAKRFVRAWEKLKKIEDKKELVNAFGKLFKTVHYSPGLVKALGILRGAGAGKYFVVAKASRLWGQLSVGGGDLGNVQPIDVEAARRIEFDQIGPKTNVDQRAKVQGLSLEKLDESTVKISFSLSHIPRFVYLRVDKTPSWGRYQNVLRMIIGKNADFKKGYNEIIINRSGEQGYKRKLARSLFNGVTSTFMLAFSIEEDRFGPVTANRFRLRSEEP